MQRLADLQSHFRDAVIHRSTQPIGSFLIGGFQPEKRLLVHQRNYQASLTETLLTKFPATEWLLGTTFLTEAARRFVREYPPSAPCIAEYGIVFPDFLTQCDGAGRLPYVREFAQLEWCIGKAAIAVNQSPIDRTAISAIEVDVLMNTSLILQSGLHYLHATWPIDELMSMYLTNTAPDEFKLAPADVWIEVRGARGEFQLDRLAADEFMFRQSILGGHTIADAAERALEVSGTFDPGRSLAAVISEGLITAIQQKNPEKNDGNL
jgi:Putative DNA-binding domain